MQNRISILKYQSFSDVEAKEFLAFLKERKKDEELLKLIKFIDKKENNSDFTIERVSKYVYKNHGKSEINKLNKTLNRLNILIDEFIATTYEFQEYENEILKLLKLLKYANYKNLDFFFEKVVKGLDKKLATYPYRDAFFYESKYKAAIEKVDYLSKQQKRKEDLQVELDQFNEYVILQKVVQVTTMLNKQMYLKKEFNYPVYSLLKQDPAIEQVIDDNPTMKIWYSCAVLLQNSPVISLWEKTIEKLKESYRLFKPTEARHIFIILENILSLQKLKAEAYHTRLLDLYLFQIAHKILFHDGFILPTTFVNIVTVSLKSKNREWVINFIEEHKDFVVLNSRYFVYNFCMAKCLMEKKDASLAMKHIQRIDGVNHKNIHLNMASRRLLIRILYHEQQNEITANEKLMQAIYAYKKYIHDKDNEIPEFHRSINSNFVNFVNRALEAITKRKIESLKKDISEEQTLPDKKWLQEIAANL